MGIFDWFTAMSRGDEKAAQTVSSAQPQGGIRDEAVIQGLDFVAAIEAHRKWKQRLTAYAEGNSTESLDHTVICRDDQCALGKWIYGQGAKHTGHLPLFHQLKAKHAQFHISASQVVELVQNAQQDAAMELILHGEFSKNSRDVQTLISKLFVEMKE